MKKLTGTEGKENMTHNKKKNQSTETEITKMIELKAIVKKLL